MPIQPHCATLFARNLLVTEKQTLREAEERAALPPRRKHEYAELQEVRAKQNAGRQNLDRFERALHFLMTDGGVRLGYLQMRFLKAARLILLHRMFGADLVSNMEYLRARFEVQRLYYTASITFPRRSGKTTVQTVLAAALAVSQPDGNICAFNLTSRQAKAWLSQAIRWLEIFQRSPEFRYTVVDRDIRETICIKNVTGTTSRISSYPGGTSANATTLRGMGERLMILMIDEFYFLSPGGYPTILPLLANGAAFLLTSSMSMSADDDIKRMLYVKLPDGREEVLRIDWIRACPECEAKGQADRCTHATQRPQHFQRSIDQARLKALMSVFGSDTYDREMRNIGARSGIEPAFRREWVEVLKDRSRDFVNTLRIDYRHFFIGVDPAGEGFSQTVLLSAAIDKSAASPGVHAPYSVIVPLSVIPTSVVVVVVVGGHSAARMAGRRWFQWTRPGLRNSHQKRI